MRLCRILPLWRYGKPYSRIPPMHSSITVDEADQRQIEPKQRQQQQQQLAAAPAGASRSKERDEQVEQASDASDAEEDWGTAGAGARRQANAW